LKRHYTQTKVKCIYPNKISLFIDLANSGLSKESFSVQLMLISSLLYYLVVASHSERV